MGLYFQTSLRLSNRRGSTTLLSTFTEQSLPAVLTIKVTSVTLLQITDLLFPCLFLTFLFHLLPQLKRSLLLCPILLSTLWSPDSQKKHGFQPPLKSDWFKKRNFCRSKLTISAEQLKKTYSSSEYHKHHLKVICSEQKPKLKQSCIGLVWKNLTKYINSTITIKLLGIYQRSPESTNPLSNHTRKKGAKTTGNGLSVFLQRQKKKKVLSVWMSSDSTK